MNWKTGMVVIAALLLAGCATTEGYRQMMETWMFIHEDDLVRRWGPPHRVHTLSNGNKVFSYLRSRTIYMPGYTTPGTATTTFAGNSAYTTYRPGVNIGGGPIGLSCETQFVIGMGRLIISYSFQGNDCTAVPKQNTTQGRTEASNSIYDEPSAFPANY